METLRILIRSVLGLGCILFAFITVGAMATSVLWEVFTHLFTREFWSVLGTILLDLAFYIPFSIPGLLVVAFVRWLFHDGDSFPPRDVIPRRGRRVDSVEEARRRVRDRMTARQSRRPTSSRNRPPRR